MICVLLFLPFRMPHVGIHIMFASRVFSGKRPTGFAAEEYQYDFVCWQFVHLWFWVVYRCEFESLRLVCICWVSHPLLCVFSGLLLGGLFVLFFLRFMCYLYA